jgi:hypothetical protein
MHKPIDPENVISTGFFKKMQCTHMTPLHDRVKEVLVPAMLMQAKSFVPEAGCVYPQQEIINEWLARFLESYMPEDQLNKHCNFHEILGSDPEITKERNKIGWDLYQTFLSDNLTQSDLDGIVQGIRGQSDDYLAHTKHPDVVENFTKRYNAFFSLAGEYSEMLSDTVSSSLDTIFRKKCFPDQPTAGQGNDTQAGSKS